MPLRLYNTLTRRLEEFRPRDPSQVTFYTCGPTVYDDAHIGNFRSFLAADLLRRWIESPLCDLANETPEQAAHRTRHGRRVTHVMNITDVGHMTDDAEGGEHGEDRMAVAGRRIAEAKKAGTLPPDADVNPADPFQIARFYERRFRDDARTLGLKVSLEADKDESLHPKATASIPGMIEVIRRLIARGNAYVVGHAGRRVVYFSVQSFEPYGRLSGNTLDKLREGEGGRISAENQAGKRHPADFLLWKEDPSHLMKWDSPWGKGYPGWHIECTVMSAARLTGAAADLSTLTLSNGDPLIDLHSGGEDNIFPHHECEIAQSCCAFNADPAAGSFASMWFHPRFLLVEGTKMSKSKGNFYTPRDLFAKGIEPAAIRLELIKTHYRSNANFTFQGLDDSQRTIERWRRAPAATDSSPIDARVAQDFAEALNDDLNIAKGVAALNTFVSAGGGSATVAALDRVLGVLSLPRPQAQQTSIALFLPGVTPSPEVESLLARRRDARAAKDFKTSDAIRDQLASMGYAIKDAPGGKVEVSRRS
ncbi:MAG: cysteine--tRNA ligase [Phycisphaerales bacterium]